MVARVVRTAVLTVLAACLAAVIVAALPGCGPGQEIRTAAGQTTFAEFDSEGNLTISGDGTADFDVVATGDDAGWRLELKTKTSRQAINATADMAAAAFRAINSALDRIQVPGIVGPPAPAPVQPTPPDP